MEEMENMTFYCRISEYVLVFEQVKFELGDEEVLSLKVERGEKGGIRTT
jgi:hypothetical protein